MLIAACDPTLCPNWGFRPESARRTKNSPFPRETTSPFRPVKLNRRRSQSHSNLELLIDLNASDVSS